MRHALSDGWELASSPPGLPADGVVLTWRPALVPGTVASSLEALGEWSFARPRDFDADVWWYRCRFDAPSADTRARVFLGFEGLATHAEVSLNGAPLLRSTNMFTRQERDVTPLLRATDNTLLIRFEALDTVLRVKRPRPRWKTRLVTQQQLRWVRTTLLGRMPGWSPPVAPVGPWRPVWLEQRLHADVAPVSLRTTLARDHSARASCAVSIHPFEWSETPTSAVLTLGSTHLPLKLQSESCESGLLFVGEGPVSGVEPWWPHTHGAQPLYEAWVEIGFVGGYRLEVPCGRVAFRSIEASTGDGGFELRVNGEPIFARGACWTTLDIVTLAGTEERYREALQLARDAGMNMLRVSGTHVYETEIFYRLCDELGLLVWQDFMFANMDYPVQDAEFDAEVRAEVTQLLQWLGGHACLAVLCGNSEVEQQAAMLGLPRESWRSSLFSELIPQLCAAFAAGVPYVSSTPTGGLLPFHVDQGVAHYYGVGAYLRPLEDARRSNVRFASECLAFAQIPENATVERVVPGGQAIFHSPAWKERVPRDNGASWDFEDVRDHYLRLLFRVDPTSLEFHDAERYLALSRVVPGELMLQVFCEWRRAASSCAGGLVWFYRDHWPGAGWGVVDSEGRPKAAYYYLKRALAPQMVAFADEGLNGLWIHIHNEAVQPLQAELRFSAWKDGEVLVLSGSRHVQLPGRGQQAIAVESLLEHFADTTYAYRFGPPVFHVAAVELLDSETGRRVGCAYHFPVGLPVERESAELGLEGRLLREGEDWFAAVRTKRFAQSIALDVPGFVCEDNYFHLGPEMEAQVRLRATEEARGKQGTAQALNASMPVKLMEGS